MGQSHEIDQALINMTWRSEPRNKLGAFVNMLPQRTLLALP